MKKGDNLYTISKKYRIGISNLIKWNNLEGKENILYIGQNINLYDYNAKSKTPGKPSNNRPINTVNKKKIYIVKKGDTLSSISRRYNIKIKDLKQLNNKKSDQLSIGEVLRVR